MCRRLFRWLAPVLVVLACALPARAQTPAPGPPKEPRDPPALPYAVAVLSTALVLCIICMPARKS